MLAWRGCCHPVLLRSDLFGNADQVIGDQIEQEVGGDASDATMFGLAHGAMLLAPSENALDHRPARLLKDAVDDRKSSGAEYVGSLADAMRRAAREFDADLPMAGTYIRKAASQVEGVSDTIRTGSFNDLVRNAQTFARRQPTAFLGISVLAGFGVVRFLKSSSEGATDTGHSNSPRGGFSQSRFAENAAIVAVIARICLRIQSLESASVMR